MENKYYTPEIEEFHVGFECEHNTMTITPAMFDFSPNGEVKKLYDKSEEIWEKKTWEPEDNFLWFNIRVDAEGCKTFSTPDNIRVKYLDREDIESLGFEFKGKALRSFFEMECQFDLPDTDSFWCKTLKIQLDEKHRTVKIEGYIASACEEETLFTGSCKNKSELKKILKMVGYQKNA